ncbi:hypothetical protein HKD37_16G045181 [Glycine soja]
MMYFTMKRWWATHLQGLLIYGLHIRTLREFKFLGHPLILEDDQLCEHNQRRRLSRSYCAYRGKISPVPLQRDECGSFFLQKAVSSRGSNLARLGELGVEEKSPEFQEPRDLRVMGEVEEVQEKMKANMEAMKEQMATMGRPLGTSTLTFRGLHILTFIGLRVLDFRGLHVLPFRGIHALAFRGLDILIFIPGPPPDIGGRLTMRAQPEREAITHLLYILGQDFIRAAAKRQQHSAQRPQCRSPPVEVSVGLCRSDIGKDCGCKTPSGLEEVQQGPGVSSSGYGPLSVLQGITPARHPVEPEKPNRVVDMPALITNLCRFYGVPVAPSKVIRPPTNRAFIKKYCAPRQAQGETPQQPGDDLQRATDAPPPPLEFTSAHSQKACLHSSGENTETFSSLTSYPELRRSEFLIGGYVGAKASLLSTTLLSVTMTQELVARGDTLRGGQYGHLRPFRRCRHLLVETFSSLTSYLELCRSEFLIGGYAAGPMTRGDTLRLSAPLCNPEAAGPMTRGDTLRLSAPLCHPEAAGPMTRGDTLRLSAPFCHPEAAGPMTRKDKIWSFCTIVSSRGGGPDDTGRYLTVIRTLFSSKGGGLDDKQRPMWSFCTLVSSRGGGPDDTRRYLTVIRTLLSSRGGGPNDTQRQNLAAGPMTRRDKIWSFCTLVSSRGGGPDDTRRYLTVIRTLLSSRGGGPDDKQRPMWSFCTLRQSRPTSPLTCGDLHHLPHLQDLHADGRKYPSGYPYKHSFAICPLGPSRIFLQKVVASGGSNLARLGELSSREEVKKKMVQPFKHFSLFRICLEKLKSKPRRFRNVSVTFSVKKFAKVSTVLRRSSFVLHRSSIFNGSIKVGLLLLRTLHRRGNQTYVVIPKERIKRFFLLGRRLSQRALRRRARARLTGALSKGGKMRGVATNVYLWKTSGKPKESGQNENSKSGSCRQKRGFCSYVPSFGEEIRPTKIGEMLAAQLAQASSARPGESGCFLQKQQPSGGIFWKAQVDKSGAFAPTYPPLERKSDLRSSSLCMDQKVVASGGSNLAHLGELGGKLLPYFAINRGRSEEGRGSAFLALRILLNLLRKIQKNVYTDNHSDTSVSEWQKVCGMTIICLRMSSGPPPLDDKRAQNDHNLSLRAIGHNCV